MLTKKICFNCRQLKTNNRFDKNPTNKSGLHSWCKDCRQEYRYANRDRINNSENEKRARGERTYARTDEQRAKAALIDKRKRDGNKQEIIRKLGGKCACCGDTTKEFLAIDHVNGGGSSDRAGIGSRKTYYSHILKQGVPTDVYQLLCHNCNMSIGAYGYCPHHPRKKWPSFKGHDHGRRREFTEPVGKGR